MESTDLVLYKSVTVSDVDANGGRMSYTQVTSGVLNNMFPNVTQDERTNGATRYRKFFYKNKNSAGETAANARVWISRKVLKRKVMLSTSTWSTMEPGTLWYIGMMFSPIPSVFNILILCA